MRKRTPKRLRWVASLLATALAAAACGAGEGGDVPEPGGTDAAGSEVHSFTFRVQQGEAQLGAPVGEEVEFTSLVGEGRPVVLNFWAGLCPPCRAEMPWFQAAVDEHGDDVLLLGLDVGPFLNLGSHEDGRELLDELDISYPTGAASNSRVIQDYGVFSMPTTVFIDADGSVVATHAGIMSEAQIDDWFTRLSADAG